MIAIDFNSLLSETGHSLHPIAIRRYQPYLKQPGVISFAGGWPSSEMFPLEIVAEIAHKVILEEGAAALQYGPTQGYEPLLEIMEARMGVDSGTNVSREHLCITAGAQQGIFLAAMTLISKGDIVAVEAPTFSGALSVFRNFQSEILSLPMDEEGLITEALEEYLRNGTRIKLLYTIPDFQNPTGRTMSAERRRTLIQLAEKYHFIILEDAPYRELRYEGPPLPSLYSLDEVGHVIYLGSFSKIFAPLRLGWVAASPALVNTMIIAKQGIDLCCPSLTQTIVDHFIRAGHLETQVDRLRDYYWSKRNVMLGGLDRYMPALCEWTEPDGGMFVWATLPEGVDTDALFFKAIDEKIAFIPGSAFFPDEQPGRSFRLNFVTASAEQIERGMAILGHVVRSATG